MGGWVILKYGILAGRRLWTCPYQETQMLEV